MAALTQPVTPYACESPVLALLSAGVPLTLLMDLARFDGPDSQRIFVEEPPESTDWIPAHTWRSPQRHHAAGQRSRNDER
jgi:hypothetical protein